MFPIINNHSDARYDAPSTLSTLHRRKWVAQQGAGAGHLPDGAAVDLSPLQRRRRAHYFSPCRCLVCSTAAGKTANAKGRCTGSLNCRVQGPCSAGLEACPACVSISSSLRCFGFVARPPVLHARSATRASGSISSSGNGAAVLTAAQAARPEVAVWLRRELEALMLESDVGMVR